MANIFGILSALVLAAAAFFGLSNKKALVDQQLVLDTETRNLATNEKTFEEAREEYNQLEADIKEATEKTAELSEKLEAQLATNKQLGSEIEDKKGAVVSKKRQVEEGNEKLAPLGNLADLKRNLQDLGSRLAAVNGDLLLKNAEIDTRQNAIGRLNTENDNLSAVLKQYSSKESNPALNTRISRVVTDLGFVILAAGDNAGIIRDSTLNVTRDGNVIGKLLVTGTEPSTSAANIIPDSFADGVKPRVGDTVTAGSN